jgi:hypothetical protein
MLGFMFPILASLSRGHAPILSGIVTSARPGNDWLQDRVVVAAYITDNVVEAAGAARATNAA